MSLANLMSTPSAYRSKIVAFGGLNRAQETSSSTQASSSTASTETAQMIDGCNVTIDLNGNLVPRAQRLDTREYVNAKCDRIKVVAECMDYNNKRNAVMAIIGKHKGMNDKEDWFFFGENESYSPYDIANACGRYITDNQMVVVNTKLCFFPSNVYFDLINHVFRTLDCTVLTTENVSIKFDKDTENTVIDTTKLNVDELKVDDVVNIYSGKNEYTHEDKGDTYSDATYLEFKKIVPTEEGAAPSDNEYLNLDAKVGGNWYRQSYMPSVQNVVVAPSGTQIEAFKTYIYQSVSELDEFRLEYVSGETESTVVSRWMLNGKTMRLESLSVSDCASRFGIQPVDESVNAYIFGVALFLKAKERTSGMTATIIKAIDKDKKTLSVEGTLYMVLFPEAKDVVDQTAQGITIVRNMPNIAHAVEWNNRVWGVSDVDNTIYACKLGDPTNWNYYQGTSMDSYYAEQASEGRWTGAGKFGSHILFFKERYIHKVFGSSPSSFQMSTIEAAGVKEGCYRSIATVNNVLIYFSRNGFMGYYGELPAKISAPLGQIRFDNVTAGYDGNKYYAHYTDGNETAVAVLDTDLGNWYIENCSGNNGIVFNFKGFLWHYDFDDKGKDSLQVINPYSNMAGTIEDDVEWYAIFKFDELLDGQKIYSRFNARIQQYTGSNVQLAIAMNKPDYESIGDKDWVILADNTQTENKDKVYIEPIVPRRCNNLYLKISGRGNCIIKSLTRSYRTAVERRN